MNDALWLLAELAATVAAFLLPGLAWTAGATRGRSRPVRLAVAGVTGLLAVPMAAFCAAWVLQTSVRPPLVLGVALALAAAGWVATRVSRRRG